MVDQKHDLIIIGGGPGGYVAAIRAAQLGLNTAVVESSHLGGICLNWGCIPTKALLRSAEVYSLMKHATNFGLSAAEINFDLPKIVARSRQVAEQLAKGVHHLLKKNKITIYNGHGKLAGRTGPDLKVSVDQKMLITKNIILATGARARALPHLKADGQHIWSYREAMVPEKCPSSLLVIGSGAIGIEFASFYNAFNTKVTVVEMQNRILPVEDEEISALAQKAFEKKGMIFKTSTTVKSLTSTETGVEGLLETSKGTEPFKVDKVIVAIGIVGNTENLGLESTKIQVEKDHIVINKWGETGEDGIYAIGDVAGAPWLAHKASHEGIIAVERIAGLSNLHPLNPLHIPGCTYSNPQIASIGLTEAKARQQCSEIKIGRFPFMANGKAIALGEPEGLVKTIFDAKTGEFLGAHMIGAEVTEMIQGYAVGLTSEITEAELTNTVFPHPTLSEMMHESALDAFGRVIHF